MIIHALIVGALILIPSLWLAPPTLWRLTASQLTVVGIFPAAYFLGILLLARKQPQTRPLQPGKALVLGSAMFGICFVAVVLAEWLFPGIFLATYPREALFTSFTLSIAGFAYATTARRISQTAIFAISIVVLTGLTGQAAFRKGWLPRPELPTQVITYAETSLYHLKVSAYKNWIPGHWRKGGGISAWGADYLVGDGNGTLYLIRENTDKKRLILTRLPHTVPLNADEFVDGARQIFKDHPKNYVESSRFRVADILIRENGDVTQILASHHYWRVDQNCFVMRISILEGTREQILDANRVISWRTLYDASPCLTLNTTNPRGPRFEGLENGGRMAFLNDGNQLLLSIGDHGFDGVNRQEMASQDTASAYGKIMLIDMETQGATIYTMGHRNVQGLYVDPSGAVWATEHGPRGGDELNFIQQGKNYGWPIVTYGTDYARQSWPFNPTQGTHLDYERPIYAFVPSVGISQLAGIQSPLFPLWQGDLLISSLKAETLWRTRIRDGRLVFAETIPISQRIRDLTLSPDGRIVLWTDDSEIVFIEPTDHQTGNALVSQCTACHGLNIWDPSTALGPNLSMIVGRPVASRDDFAYSDALKDFGGRWTRERLDRFLANPQDFVPGVNMQFPGIEDPEQRTQLIDFLENLPTSE